MDKDKRKRSKNFSEFEKTLFKQIVSNYPVIENKQHDSGTENKKKKAWISILNEFNSNEKVTKRTLQQVQVLWKNIKINLKKTTAATRQERFKTGGGLPVPPDTEELGDLLAGIIESQQPLEGIPDDDHLDSSGNSQEAQMNPSAASTNMQQHPVSCGSISQHPAVSNPGSRSRGKRMTIHEKLAIEFHECKLKYLKEEHEVKMKILHLELSMKEREMKQQQCQLSLEPNLS
ncbi:MSD3 protein, partial [Polypterus senegalus]|nr:MSD3 protein [Polypterus senegalus]